MLSVLSLVLQSSWGVCPRFSEETRKLLHFQHSIQKPGLPKITWRNKETATRSTKNMMCGPSKHGQLVQFCGFFWANTKKALPKISKWAAALNCVDYQIVSFITLDRPFGCSDRSSSLRFLVQYIRARLWPTICCIFRSVLLMVAMTKINGYSNCLELHIECAYMPYIGSGSYIRSLKQTSIHGTPTCFFCSHHLHT